MKVCKYLFIILLTLFLSCERPVQERKNEKSLILVSIAPFKFFVEKIVSSHLRVETIVPPGSSSHSYEPTPKKITSYKDAALWFQIGDSFEQKIQPVLLQHNPKLVIYDLRKTVPLLPYEDETVFDSDKVSCKEHSSCQHHKNSKDPHIWLSPRLAKIEAQKIAEELSKCFPEFSDDFQKNLLLFQKELDETEKEINNYLKTLENRSIIVSHPAFGYFCKDFALKQISVEYDGKDPLPQRLQQILKKIKEENVQMAVFIPQYNNKGAKLIADRLHIPYMELDPYAEDYLENLKRIAEGIAITETTASI